MAMPAPERYHGLEVAVPWVVGVGAMEQGEHPYRLGALIAGNEHRIGRPHAAHGSATGRARLGGHDPQAHG